MQAELQACNMQFLFISAIVALGILSLIIGRKIFQKIIVLIRALKMHTFQQKPIVVVDLQREVAELRKATLQITQDWTEVRRLMAAIKDQQSGFAQRLDEDFVVLSDSLQASLRMCLEEECLRNDQRFGRIHKTVDGFKEGFDGLKQILQKHGDFMDRLPRLPVAEAWTQTERELLVRKRQQQRDGSEKDDTAGEYGPSRSIITVIRKALVEFLKEAKRQMSLQRDELMSDLKKVFTQLAEDRDDLKNTIESAFTTAAHQTQASFLQFGNVGREAMQCIAVLNTNTERAVTVKFQDACEKLKGVFELLKNLNFDVSCIKQTLDNIDGQFDEIYRKLELGCQKNADHSEEVAKSLQKTAQEWNEKSSQLDETCKQLACASHAIRDTLVNLDNALCNRPGRDTEARQHHNNQSLVNHRVSVFELEPDNLLMMVQICQEKLVLMKNQIDENTCGVKQSAELLLDELRLLTNLVENNVETLKNLTIKMPDDSEDHLLRTLKQEPTEFVGDIFNLDTISEITEDVQDEKDPELKNSCELPGLIEIIDADLDMALHSKCIGDITKNSQFFNKTIKNSEK